AAAGGSHQRLFETAFHRLDQRPRAHVGHLHAFGSMRDRSGLLQVFEQLGFPWPDGDVWAAHNAKTRTNFSWCFFLSHTEDCRHKPPFIAGAVSFTASELIDHTVRDH